MINNKLSIDLDVITKEDNVEYVVFKYEDLAGHDFGIEIPRKDLQIVELENYNKEIYDSLSSKPDEAALRFVFNKPTILNRLGLSRKKSGYILASKDKELHTSLVIFFKNGVLTNNT